MSSVISFTYAVASSSSTDAFTGVVTVAMHGPGGWDTLYRSAALEFGGAAPISVRDTFALPQGVALDGWARVLLHAPGVASAECYAFLDLPAAQLATAADATPPATIAVGTGATLRVSLHGVGRTSPKRTPPLALDFDAVARQPSPDAMAQPASPIEATAANLSIASPSPRKRLDMASPTAGDGAGDTTGAAPASTVGAAHVLALEEKVAALTRSLAEARAANAAAADAAGRAAREQKLRLAVDERRAAAEGTVAELQAELKRLETARMAADVAAAEASARAAAAEERASLSSPRQDWSARGTTGGGAGPGAASPGGSSASALAAAAAAGAPPQPSPAQWRAALIATRNALNLFVLQAEDMAATCHTACAAAAAAAGSSGSGASTQGAALQALVARSHFDRDATRAAQSRRATLELASTAAGGAAFPPGDAALLRVPDYTRLLACHSEAVSIIPRLSELLQRGLAEAEAALKSLKSERAAGETAHEAALEERGALVKSWSSYAEHWEKRGREAEGLVAEWEAHSSRLSTQRDALIAEVAALRGAVRPPPGVTVTSAAFR